MSKCYLNKIRIFKNLKNQKITLEFINNTNYYYYQNLTKKIYTWSELMTIAKNDSIENIIIEHVGI